MIRRRVPSIGLATPLAALALAIAGVRPEQPGPGLAQAQGGVHYTEVRFSNRAGDRILGVGGSYIDSNLLGGNLCVASWDSSPICWLRTARAGNECRHVIADLTLADNRVLDSDGDYSFASACGATPFQLKTGPASDPVNAGVNTVYDLILDTESPWKPSATSNGIRVDRVVLNVHHAFCNAFTLQYDRPFRVGPGSNANERIVTTDGGGASLYKQSGNRRIYLGHFQVPMQYTVIRRT